MKLNLKIKLNFEWIINKYNIIKMKNFFNLNCIDNFWLKI